MDENELTLKLSVEEVKIIFNALASRPFQEVYELIGKINEQANHQVDSNKDTDGQFLMNTDE